MTDTPASTENSNDPVFAIQRVYLKEASLEQPNSPAILLEQDPPSVDIQLKLEASTIAEDVHEVTVTTMVHAKIGDRTLFLAEAQQAGIFEIRNIPDDQMEPVLRIACPQIVFPYLRGNLADIIQRAGFPPVHLAEINFQAMYEQQRAEDGAAAVANDGSSSD